MSLYRVQLTPTLVNLGTEGGLDTSIVDGVSIQRTCYFDVYNSTNKKTVELVDGAQFDDVIASFSDNVNIVPVSED